MEDMLKRAVAAGPTIYSSINTEVLKQHTTQIDLATLDTIQWDRLRWLYILGYGGCPELKKGDSMVHPGCYVDQTQQWILLIGSPSSQIERYISGCSEKLERLTLRFTDLEEINVENLPGLQSLDLSDNSMLVRAVGLGRLMSLENLNLAGTNISNLDRVIFPKSLKRLNLARTRVSDLDKVIFPQKLDDLDLAGTSISNLDRVIFPKSLKRLNLAGTHVSDLDKVIFPQKLDDLDLAGTNVSNLDNVLFPPELTVMSISYTPLRRIPARIRSLRYLKKLYLDALSLEELPPWLPELGLPFCRGRSNVGISLRNTVVDGVDMSIFDQPQEMILRWFSEQNSDSLSKPLNEPKVVFLGDGEAGKSFMISRLLADGRISEKYQSDTTPGIVINEKKYSFNGRDILLRFWDFGGQEILHSMHRLFLTPRALYVVVLNARDDTQHDRARYWFNNIKAFVGDAPVILVLNKIDQNPKASVNERELRRITPSLTEVLRVSALYDSCERFNESLTNSLLRQASQIIAEQDMRLPVSWERVRENLQSKESSYIRLAEYKKFCWDAGIQDNLQRNLLKWFTYLGICMHYTGSDLLEDRVILQPEWLTNAICMIIFNRLESCRNGIVPLKSMYELLGTNSDLNRHIYRVRRDWCYMSEEVDYVLQVLRRYRLSFALSEQEEFIPMLCSYNILPIAKEYEDDPNVLEFRTEYDYLPINVLHQLMVDRRKELDVDNVWLNGARFVQRSIGLSAVIRIEGNSLRIFAHSADPQHSPNQYLNALKESVDRICRNLQLDPLSSWIIYKADGTREEFDYDDLLCAMEDGEDTYRSRILRRRIPISDILKQTGHPVDANRESLVRDVLMSCNFLQDQKFLFDRNSEDMCNHYICDLLSQKGYFLMDQTFLSTNKGWHAGELDLEIRKNPNIPWTVLEALRIKGLADRYYWNAHLQRLLDCMGRDGVSFGFLVSYLECRQADFQRIAVAYLEHMRLFEPKNCIPLSCVDVPVEYNRYIRMSKCTYDCWGIPATVYHICVRIGD